MRFTMSKDGVPRTTISVRLSRDELRRIAYSAARRATAFDLSPRMATQEEARATIIHLLTSEPEWGAEYGEEFDARHVPNTRRLMPLTNHFCERGHYVVGADVICEICWCRTRTTRHRCNPSLLARPVVC